ncbi:MAG: HAD family hydrolase [Ruminococcaceae bacterium]|nr:HAD family hydrolase [Oscillospiraceae bacterium]
MNMIKYKAVIFDLDGTLLDTSKDLAISVNFALAKHGFQTHPEYIIPWFTGNGMKMLIKRAIGSEVDENVFNAVFQDFTAHYSVHANDHTRVYDGIEDLIARLKKSGVKLAVLSNKKHAPTSYLIDLHFPHTFDIVYGEGGEITRKPETKGFWKILTSFGIDDPRDVLYIGDSEVDVMTVKNAHCDSIFVSWGFRTKQHLMDAGAEIIVDSTDEIIERIFS